jgi:predicted ATPase
MITRIDLELFKCFELLKLPLSSLTLLSGANASGKSTVMQALVLLHQTMLEHEWSTRLQLNGPELSLGTVSDVVDKVYGRRAFGIGLIDTLCQASWLFDFDENKQDMSVAVRSVTCQGTTVKSPDRLRFLLPDPRPPSVDDLAHRIRRLSYLTAERFGPREAYQLQDPSAVQVVGPRGENAVGLLHLRLLQNVVEPLVVPGEPPTLLKQVESRMRQFFPGVSLRVEQVPQTNIVTMGLRTTDATDFHRPVNVGFGLTQVLPIVVAALSAKPSDLLLIENPEVHLHPAGQALMGRFLCEVAAAGIQVIVETHCDHVLNGIRRAVKAKVIKPDRVALHFFRPRNTGGEQVATPIMDEVGNIDRWPEGFFDQFDKDMNHFAGWGE